MPLLCPYISSPDVGRGLVFERRMWYNKRTMKDIYIVLSQTRSIVSRLIRLATGDMYTHVSIGFEDEPGTTYSFGRIFPHNPLWGGFVRESVTFGTMKRFRDADAAAIRIRIEDGAYERMRRHIAAMYADRRRYGYNYIGLLIAKFGIAYRCENRYYCSEFLKELLERFGVVPAGELSEVVRPADFLNIRCGELIYRGSLYKFAAAQRRRTFLPCGEE